MKYLVTRVVKFTKVIEADSKQEALENFGDLNADTQTVMYFAKKIKQEVK